MLRKKGLGTDWGGTSDSVRGKLYRRSVKGWMLELWWLALGTLGGWLGLVRLEAENDLMYSTLGQCV